MRRALRRAALFLWMTPFTAALSRALVACRAVWVASSSLPWAMSRSVFFMKVRARERKTRFRSLLRAEDLSLFFADAVVAKRPPWLPTD